jgi:molybdate transport system substrate-binding protein
MSAAVPQGIVKGISSMAMRQVLYELAKAYEQRSQWRIALTAVGGVEAARRVGEGEPFDFVVLAADAIEQLVAAGNADADSRVALASSEVAIAVREGMARPDISSESAVRAAVLDARSVGYSTGPSGVYLARLFARWGVAESRIVQAPPGVPVATLLARGEVELGFQQLSELMHVPGVEIVGGLPADIQLVTLFAAAICSTSRQRAATHDLLAFLASPEADAAKQRHGMQAARP